MYFQACDILFSCISPICENLIESCASFCIYRNERNCKLVKNIEKYFKKKIYFGNKIMYNKKVYERGVKLWQLKI